MTVFQYKVRKKFPVEPPLGKPEFASEAEQLIGEWDGMPASDIEERWAKATAGNPKVLQTEFRVALGAPKGMPGWKELDFLHNTVHGWKAIEIDDTSFVHKGASGKAEIVNEDIVRLMGLRQLGINVPEIIHVDGARLQTQDDAKRAQREIIG